MLCNDKGDKEVKYIRTKDGVFEFEDFTKTRGKRCLNHYGYQAKNGVCILGTLNDWKEEQKADTIEELCDEFVDTSELKTTNTGGWLYDEFDSKNKCLVYYAEDEKRAISLNEYDDLSKIYGAIWTNKGLIFVAKMNEKGELELL